MIRVYPPFAISPSLKPGLFVGGAWLCLERGRDTGVYVKPRFAWSVLLPDGNEQQGGDDLRGWGDLTDMFGAFLGFLGACGESWPDGENAKLFPPSTAAWAAEHVEDLSIWAYDIETRPFLVIDQYGVVATCGAAEEGFASEKEALAWIERERAGATAGRAATTEEWFVVRRIEEE
jgi:hypothetical protein